MSGSDRSEAHAAEVATAADDLAAGFGGHAGAEAMLAHTTDLLRLILAFHVILRGSRREQSGGR